MHCVSKDAGQVHQARQYQLLLHFIIKKYVLLANRNSEHIMLNLVKLQMETEASGPEANMERTGPRTATVLQQVGPCLHSNLDLQVNAVWSFHARSR